MTLSNTFHPNRISQNAFMSKCVLFIDFSLMMLVGSEIGNIYHVFHVKINCRQFCLSRLLTDFLLARTSFLKITLQKKKCA